METIVNIISLVYFASEFILLLVKRSKNKEVKIRRDKASMIILWVVILSALFLGSYVREFINYNGLSLAMFIAGISIMVIGSVIRWTAIFQLKDAFTVDVAVSKEQKVKDDGLYTYIRHPSYSGLLLTFLGLSLLFGNWVSVPVIIVPIFFAVLYRIQVEEKLLEDSFVDNYKAYEQRTKRIIPGVF